MKRRNIRKRAIMKRLKKEDRLPKDTARLIKKANARLDALKRRFRSGTWASKKLKIRLSHKRMKFWTKKGRIKIPKNASRTQLIALNKAINQFLESKTSTTKGIKSIRKEQIERLYNEYHIENDDFTYEDAEDFYDMYGDQDFNYFAEKIGSSETQALIFDSIANNDNQMDFLLRLGLYGDINDVDVKRKTTRLYNKFIKNRNI